MVVFGQSLQTRLLVVDDDASGTRPAGRVPRRPGLRGTGRGRRRVDARCDRGGVARFGAARSAATWRGRARAGATAARDRRRGHRDGHCFFRRHRPRCRPQMGADDYIAKPFDPRELLARVRACCVGCRLALRRWQQRAPPAAPGCSTPAADTVRSLRDRPRGTAHVRSLGRWRGGGDHRMEYDLLRVFLANPNRVLSRDQLLTQTRNREWEPFDRSIDIRIAACGARSRRTRRPSRAASAPCETAATCTSPRPEPCGSAGVKRPGRASTAGCRAAPGCHPSGAAAGGRLLSRLIASALSPWPKASSARQAAAPSSLVVTLWRVCSARLRPGRPAGAVHAANRGRRQRPASHGCR